MIASRYVWLVPLAIGRARGSSSPAARPDGAATTATASAVNQERHTISPVAAHHQHPMQAENDSTAQQAAQVPGRLVAFCGLNPVRSYAVDEMDRCASMPAVGG